MSMTPTAGSAAPKSSGRWVMQAPTSRPPLEPPWMASLGVTVYFSLMSHSAAAMKSSKTFCLWRSFPASYQSRPYSLPPRRQARVVGVGVVLAPLAGGPELLVVPEFRQPRGDGLPLGDPAQIGLGHLVLGRHPGGGFGRAVIL